jgi:signal transduction histidine kinase/CheY-like chemotaxis protein
LATVFFGFAWGSAGVVMFRPEFTGYQMLLTLGLFLVTFVGGATGYTPFIPLVYAFAIPAITPLLIRTAITGDFLHWMVAAGGLFVLALILYYAKEVNGLIAESINLRFENQLARDRAEEANRAKSRFLAAASHDLRQPLHTLSLYSAALKLHAAAGATGDIASHINKALASLSALVDSLLDISKLDAGAVKPERQSVPVRTLIERIEADYRPVARDKGLAFRALAADVLVNTDPVLLERLVRNLVDNAFKCTVEGSVTLAAEIHESTVRIAVCDTGWGIPAGERERIFEEFYQIGNPERDRSQGLGLGLAIVQRLVRLLGLEFTLESETGRGSTFAVAMPRLFENGTTPRETVRPVVPENARALEGARVLVIDDEPEVRAGMKTLLEYLGCRVVVCSGLVEAEQMLDQQTLEPDIIVADFRLRQHENGIDTVRRLRGRLGDVPALLVTGDTAPERLREAQSSGLPLLHKPVSADKLTETILAAMRR